MQLERSRLVLLCGIAAQRVAGAGGHYLSQNGYGFVLLSVVLLLLC